MYFVLDLIRVGRFGVRQFAFWHVLLPAQLSGLKNLQHLFLAMPKRKQSSSRRSSSSRSSSSSGRSSPSLCLDRGFSDFLDEHTNCSATIAAGMRKTLLSAGVMSLRDFAYGMDAEELLAWEPADSWLLLHQTAVTHLDMSALARGRARFAQQAALPKPAVCSQPSAVSASRSDGKIREASQQFLAATGNLAPDRTVRSEAGRSSELADNLVSIFRENLQFSSKKDQVQSCPQPLLDQLLALQQAKCRLRSRCLGIVSTWACSPPRCFTAWEAVGRTLAAMVLAVP